MRILVVDDHPFDRKLLVRLIEALEFYADPPEIDPEDGEELRVPDFYDEMEFGRIAQAALGKYYAELSNGNA